MRNRWWRLLQHRRYDERDARRVLGPQALERITAHVTAGEARHTGEIRVCIEAGLPLSYIKRHASARERALALFGKLRVWDTEQNNGVLIYLLLAERAVEIVADRGAARCVQAPQWQRITALMTAAFASGDFERGLEQGIDAVGELLAQHFALAPGQTRSNELADAPDLR